MNGRYFKHGKLKEYITRFFSFIPRLHPIDGIPSMRVIAMNHDMQLQTRKSTEPGKVWVFLRPKKKAGEVSSTGQTPHPSTRQGARL